MLVLQYTDPAAYPPVEHATRLLAEAGCDVRCLGLDVTHGSLRMDAHPGVTTMLLPARPAGWRQRLQFVRFLIWASWHGWRWRPDWIYASDPLSAPAALLARAVSGARIIYHEHDAPSSSMPSAFFRAALAARRRILREAVVVVPNRERARLAGVTGAAHVAANMPLRREVGEARDVEDRRPGLRVVYHGSIVPARLPLTVVDALADLPDDVTLTIAGYDPTGTGYLDAIRARAAGRGVLARVQCLGVIRTRAELLDLAGSCDVGLALMPTATGEVNEQTMVGASNKPFDYLARGLAVVVTEERAWRDAYVTPGFGVACVPEDAGSIAASLRWLLEHPRERREMGEAGRRRVRDEWHYERQFASVLQLVTGQAASDPARVMAAAGV